MSKTMKLLDMCNITTGKLDSNHAESGGIYPFFTCAKDPVTINSYAFDDDVVLIAGNNAQGNFHLNRYKGKFNAYQRTYVLTAKNGNDLDFVYYSLRLELQRLKDRSQGSQTKFLTMPILNDIHIVKTDPKLQKKISSVLSSLDAKIDLNNRINAELEAMAKTLYDYWFVQFDFPDKNGKPYKSSGGKMVWNKELKREIPEGWSSVKLVEWLKADKSGDWGKADIEGHYTERVYCIRGADINGLNGIQDCNPPVRYILQKNRYKYLNTHDLILEISGGSPTQSTGRMAYITERTLSRFNSPLICSNFCKAISLKNAKNLYNFAFYWNSLYDNGILFGFEGKTSGIKNLLFDSFVNSYWSVLPNDRVTDCFYGIMSDIQSKKQVALEENSQLSSLRDWLLPMLMNGQVAVS